MLNKLAERKGFEPSIRFWRIHTFQACAFDHSATSLKFNLTAQICHLFIKIKTYGKSNNCWAFFDVILAISTGVTANNSAILLAITGK